MKLSSLICYASLVCLGAFLPQDQAVSQALRTEPVSSSSILAVGESHSFCVASVNFYNDSRVCLVAGAHYTFHVDACSTWKDLQIVTDANGWTAEQAPFGTRRLVRRMEWRRRFPTANWFELVGTIGQNECNHFRIGCGDTGKKYSPTVSGPFYAFANDLPSKYRNNSGSIRVTIKRVE